MDIIEHMYPGVVVEIYNNARMDHEWKPFEISDRELVHESSDGRILFTAIDLTRKRILGDVSPCPMMVPRDRIRIKKGGE